MYKFLPTSSHQPLRHECHSMTKTARAAEEKKKKRQKKKKWAIIEKETACYSHIVYMLMHALNWTVQCKVSHFSIVCIKCCSIFALTTQRMLAKRNNSKKRGEFFLPPFSSSRVRCAESHVCFRKTWSSTKGGVWGNKNTKAYTTCMSTVFFFCSPQSARRM